jgi:hypothetical protein
MITGQSKTVVVESTQNIDVGLNSGNALVISVEGTGFSGTVNFQTTIDGNSYSNHPYSGYRQASPTVSEAEITNPSTAAAYILLPPVTQARIAVTVSSGSVSIRYVEISYMHDVSTNASDMYITADGDGSPSDGGHLVFGAGDDATIYYDGTNLRVNPKLVGSGGLIVDGDLTVSGATTTVSSTTLTVADPLVKYNQGDVNAARDAGFIVTRGNSSATNTANRGFIWDSSEGEFAAIAANTEAGTTSGNVSIDDYVDLRVGAITADDASTFSTSIALASGATVTGIDTNTSLGTSNTLLATQGAIKSYVDAQSTGDALTSNPLSQFAATTSAQLRGVLNDETGTGSAVFATDPVLVAPRLGTPHSGVATNLSGTAASLTAGNVTTNANLTGMVTSSGNTATVVTNANLTGHIVSSGNATTLGTSSFTSAHLAGALTNESGTGLAVFNTSPTLVTPALGTPASGDMSNMSGLVNAGVGASAAIAYSKLAALADGNILVGSGSNVATSVNPSGAVDISNAGVFSIATDAIDSAHYAGGSIDTEHIANSQITNALMADDAIGVAELSATGTASSGTFLRGDNSWAATAAAYTDAEAVTAVEAETTLVLAGDVSVAADKAISLLNEGKVKFTDTTFGDGNQRSSGITLRFTTSSLAIAIGQAVHLSGTTVILADADVGSQGAIPCIGVAASATTGSGTEAIDVLVLGCMRYDTYDFTAGSDVFVTATPGVLDETAPSTDGHYVQKVGIAISADILYVNPSLDVIEHA